MFCGLKDMQFRDVDQLVDRLVWDQEALGSSPSIPTAHRDVAQLVRAHALYACGHGFDSRRLYLGPLAQ
jgi:hypothetical protein